MNKKYLIAAFAATAMVLSGASIAEDSGFMITPSIGMFDYEDDRINDPVRPAELDHDLFGSLGVGYRFNSPWALELVYKYGETETTTATPSDVDYQGIHVDGLYHFDNDSRITPYLAFGGGYAETEADDTSKTIDETNLNAGGGFKFALNDLLSLRADLRAFREFDEHYVDLAASLGLQFLFGGSSAAPVAVAAAPIAAAVIADTDKDGVADSSDRCAKTPMGTQVDANGCALDADGDGVANHRDNCPDSEVGSLVDAKGCYVTLTVNKEIQLKVNFANNSDEVTPEYYAEIQRVADFMRQYPMTSVVIEGHTDSRGSASYNQQLSERRAYQVASTLVSRFNITGRRVASAGYGEVRPIANNDTANGRAANRRVVAVVSATVEERAGAK